MKRKLRWVLTPCLLLWTTSLSQAFVPLVQETRSAGRPAHEVSQRIPLPVEAWEEFLSRHPGSWKMDWDGQKGSPRAIYGASIEIGAASPRPGNLLEDRLLSFVDRNSELFGVASDDLEVLSMRQRGRLFFATFRQVSGAVPVYGGHLQVRLARDGRIVAISTNIYRGVGEARPPAFPAERAKAIAKHDASFAEGKDLAIEPALVIYPHAVSGTWRFPTSWMVELVTREVPGHWFYAIDATTGSIIEKWNQIYYDDAAADSLFGRVEGHILPETPTDTLETHAFKDLEVRLLSGGADVTGPDGDYLIESDGPDTVLAELSGPFVDVENEAGEDAGVRIAGLPGTPTPILWDDANSQTPERNGFYHTVLVHDYMRNIDSSFTDLDYSMPCRVNINQTCNAFWDGLGINFFREGGGCENTANIADVIYHEYGHGVTDFQYRPLPNPSGDMHEGLSDYLGATITNQPLIGRGFFGPGTAIRSTENDRVWPAPECGGEPHCVGEAIAGALWDMRENLIATLGEAAGIALADSLFHYARYGYSEIFPDYFIDLLILDDDDGDLTNGIPHDFEICDAFENHGLSCVLTPNMPLVYDVGNGSELFVVWQRVPSLLSPVADYRVYYGTTPGTYPDSLSSAGDTSIVASGLSEGTRYFFAVAAQDSLGRMSLLSEEGSGMPLSVPLPPTGFAAYSHRDDVSLVWAKNKELDIDAYMIARSLFADSAYSPLAQVGAGETTYVDTELDPGVMYFYTVAAGDTSGELGAESEPVRGRLMSMDSGILVVDGTKDGQEGPPYSFPDETVDEFYERLLARYRVAGEFDIADSLAVSRFPLDDATLAAYSTIVWHEDDRNAAPMTSYLEDLGSYLAQGGNLFLSGWNLVKHASDAPGGTVVFPPGSFPYEYLKLDSTEVLATSEKDLDGATSLVSGYPDLAVDSTKAWLLSGNLFNSDVIYPPLVDEPLTEPLYAYHSSLGDTAPAHGEIVGLRYLGGDYGLVLLDVPLFYMEESAAGLAMARAMEDLGETVGIAGDEEEGLSLPRAYALFQNYPNPFNPSTTILVDIPESAAEGGKKGVRTRVVVYNMRGHLVKMLMDAEKAPGRYVLSWDGKNDRGEHVGSGVYLCRMEAGDITFTRKMVVLK